MKDFSEMVTYMHVYIYIYIYIVLPTLMNV